jgi:hypothetical protein
MRTFFAIFPAICLIVAMVHWITGDEFGSLYWMGLAIFNHITVAHWGDR